jgi:hypothetical protein
MKLKRLTKFTFITMIAAAMAISSCKKEKEKEKEVEEGPRPKITLRAGPVGTLEWLSANATRGADVDIKFGVKAEYDKPLTKIRIVRRITDGPSSGTEAVLLDSTLNPADNILLFPASDFFVVNSKSGLARQTVVFTISASANDGSTGTLAIEVRPEVTLGIRENQKIFSKNEDGAYDVVQGINMNLNQDAKMQDIRLTKTSTSFKFTSGNGTKFRHYNGSLIWTGFMAGYDRIETAWAQGGSEMTESKEFSDASYKLIVVRSGQNNRLYIINVFNTGADFAEFDVIGEGL